jgi:two-component system, chemotaxis family, CheB/CheR fusion protein
VEDTHPPVFNLDDARDVVKPRLAPSAPCVVGIGASAGGLAALERFFDNLPERPGMAFVVVQHLSPDFKSLMDELLARHTALPIHLVEDGVSVEVNHIYLIPPRMEMIISAGRLLLSERGPQSELSLPIDTFFRSLARDCGHRAVAIVLSGGGTDGSRGIRDVRDAGGLVLVQDTGTAQFDGMPKTARDAGVAHWVLAPQDMPHVLLEHLAQSHPARHAREAAERSSLDAGGIEAVYQMLEEKFGIDFTHYKPSTITRRIERRLSLAQSANIDEYVRRLRHDHDELDTLYRDLLIGVTHFFRDEDVFRMLEDRVLPDLLEQGARDQAVRLWVAGCATGEEAYSLAITLQDVMRKVGVGDGERPVKIFATDVHRGSLERAARAIYDAEAVARVSPERLERYFLRFGDAYQVAPDIRKMIVFAQHNVMRDAPFTRVDLVTCRNLLIYLQPAAQNKALALFHFALKRGGRLLLGPSETVGALAPEFAVIDKHWRLYEKKTDMRLAFDARPRPAPPAEPRLTLPGVGQAPSLTQLVGTYDAILETFMPPSLLVGDRGELVHAFGGASRFLRLRDGRQDLNVVDMVDPGLKMLLVGGLRRALQETNPLVFKDVRFEATGDAQPYDVTLRRIRGRATGTPHVLISIEETRPADRPPVAAATEVHLDQVSRDQLTGLEAELLHTRENLQSAIEELETSNEELQAANEELQASNEELQSTNEELQSVNEELYTVNAEYQRKISELTELTNDMDNLLASTEVGTVFLDRQLKIRKFTPQIADTFALVPHDVGRPIETFAYKLDHPELVGDLRRVLSSSEPIERELRDARGKAFFLRILPYRAKGTVDGVVLTLIDVSGLKAAEDALFHERHLLNSLMANVQDAIYFKDRDGKFIRANQPMATRLGLRAPEDVAGKTAAELPERDLGLALHRHDEAVLETGVAEHQSLEAHRSGDATHWDSVTRLPLRDPAGRIVGTGVIFRDVTEQKRAEESIREAVRRRDQFLAMLSHELRNPLSAIVSATGLLKVARAQPASERFLEVLERQTQQMTRLLDELLEASRVTENKIELRREILDLNAVVREALEAVRAQLDGRALEVTTELAAQPLLIDGDAARLQQVLVNLLNNAAKYTPMHGHVTIATGRRDGLASISVKDDGAGIPPDLIESVFELFVQSPRTLDRSAGGLGVGLSLARSLVAMHGGKVAALSDGEGKGSEFVVSLPIAGADRVVAPAPRVDERAHDCEVPGHAELVIVEDNADSRELLCELLELSGLRCRGAEGGAAALVLVEEKQPDAMIIDLGLPGMDGFELARAVRERPGGRDICLIALTGYGQPSDRERGRSAGFDAHLVKPVQPEELLTLLRKLGRPRADVGSASESARARDGVPKVAPAPTET